MNCLSAPIVAEDHFLVKLGWWTGTQKGPYMRCRTQKDDRADLLE